MSIKQCLVEKFYFNRKIGCRKLRTIMLFFPQSFLHFIAFKERKH